jgi:D-glycero-alpha-D-manno-heptose-7-phosphate kinase
MVTAAGRSVDGADRAEREVRTGREVRAVRAHAPVRVCDVGGWTDTWFGSPGQVCSIAVSPGVQVLAELVHQRGPAGDGAGPVHLVAPDLGEDYRFGPATPSVDPAPTPSADADPGVNAGVDAEANEDVSAWDGYVPVRQPLLEHAVAEVLTRHPLAPGETVRVTITSAVPVGASLGTSAAVLVALLAALDGLLGGHGLPAGSPDAPDPVDGPDLARRAHAVETGRAGREAGVQDHWAAALGHAQHLVVDTYPSVRARRLALADHVAGELAERLVTVVFGPHDSSAVHGEVVHALLSCDGAAHDRVRQATRRLAALAAEAAGALERGDVDAWAAVLSRSTGVQAELHPGLVGPAHQAAIEVAASLGAAGWKVNGAGGSGGSLTVVAGRSPGRGGSASAAVAELRERLVAADPTWTVLDLTPAGGLTIEIVPAAG